MSSPVVNLQGTCENASMDFGWLNQFVFARMKTTSSKPVLLRLFWGVGTKVELQHCSKDWMECCGITEVKSRLGDYFCVAS